MPSITPCQISSSRASAGCTTVLTSSPISPQSQTNRLPKIVMAALMVPPRIGANAWEKLLATPGRNTVSR